MDHMMPVMDGIETVQKIRSVSDGKYRQLPVIALTADIAHGMKDVFFKNGFSDFISKPIDFDELEKLLAEWIPAEKICYVLKEEKESKSAKAGPELVRFFNQRLLGECSKMTAFLLARDIAGFEPTIHAMKTSLAIIGEHALAKIAEELETAAKKYDLPHCRKYYVKFEKHLYELHERLNVIYPPIVVSGPANREHGDVSFLHETVASAIVAANDFDSDSAVAKLRTLSDFDFGAKVSAQLNEALTAFEDFKFDKAEEILKSIRGD
jgi:HPt (histidine-containing phosphotransfer) domain-containing protein